MYKKENQFSGPNKVEFHLKHSYQYLINEGKKITLYLSMKIFILKMNKKWIESYLKIADKNDVFIMNFKNIIFMFAWSTLVFLLKPHFIKECHLNVNKFFAS